MGQLIALTDQTILYQSGRHMCKITYVDSRAQEGRMVTAKDAVRCRFGQCRGNIALVTEGNSMIAICLFCGREPNHPARLATPEHIARANRDAFVRRVRHHRVMAPAAYGGG